MSHAEPSADIRWEDGDVPVSVRYADPYYAREDGLAETAHVFLQGNRLAERWGSAASGFQIAELGFGTGLSFLLSWHLWRNVAAPGAELRMTSFEIAPLSRAQMARALSPWPELAVEAAELLGRWRGGGLYDFGDARLEVVLGDARETVPAWKGKANAWFLDGFAPARNPEMWEPQLLAAVGRRTAPGGTLATYTAAGRVRRGLAAAGFLLRRVPGFGRKREITVGSLASDHRG
ncbi:MAG: tRNA (5-methylaminomethyl-2-thiouridine)(34)-methyltransferase MnmD [Pseudomonadota bacterium]